MRRFKIATALAVLLVVLLPMAQSQSVVAVEEGKYLVDGNPTCSNLYGATVLEGPSYDLSDLGPLYGFKYDANPKGDLTHTLTDDGIWVVTNGPQDPNNSVSIFNVLLGGEGQGIQFDWSATLGIDAVIVKAQDANAYVYAPEAFGDAGLMAPDSKAISHVEFCYDYELDVSKDANTSFTRTYEWDITKTPDADYVGFAGDAFPHEYTITVNRTGYTDSDWAVDGTITIENNTPFASEIVSVTDEISDYGPVAVDCGDLSYPYILAAGDTLECSYSEALPDDTNRTNTATVTTSGEVDGGVATAKVSFGDNAEITEINAMVNVTDDYGTPDDTSDDRSFGPLADGASVNYSRNFTCSTDQGDYSNGKYSDPTLTNTAKIDETGDWDTAEVNLTCYAPVLQKDASASYDERHDWDVEKSVDPESQKAFAGDPVDWTWTVDIVETVTDENFAVTGVISVTNPTGAPNSITVNLADGLNDGTVATVDCGEGATSVTVAPGATEICSYSAAPADASATLNTATGTFNGLDFTATADVNFNKNVVNDSATFSDPYLNIGDTVVTDGSSTNYPDGAVCSSDQSDYGEDGYYTETITNTAYLVDSENTEYESSAATTYTCYAPVLDKDATGSYDENHTWEIEKTVDPLSQKAFAGDPVSWTWTVTVTESSVDENFAVTGAISVTNPMGAPGDMTVDLVDYLDDGTSAVVDCGGGVTSVTVAPGSIKTCSYTAGPTDPSATLNTVVGTFNEIDFTATADVTFAKNVLNGTATVDDDQEPDFPLELTAGEGPWTWSETENSACSSDTMLYEGDGTYTFGDENTATVTGSDGQTDNASADTTVACYAPVVDKTANGYFDRDWTWTIEKEGDQTELTLDVGEFFFVNYEVTVDATYQDSNYRVVGTISVENPRPDADMMVGLTDVLDVGGAATITACNPGVWDADTEMLTVPAGQTAVCDYRVDLGDDGSNLPTLNTATATLNDIDFEASDDVSFEMDTETDECVDVTDDKGGSLGTVCKDQAPKTFEYTLQVGPYELCGEYEFINTASFITNDNGETGKASWSVLVDVPCDFGCTYTQGYWKTHSEFGPAPYDDTWAELENGASTMFFGTGKTYYEIFQMAPKGGNAYIILAHQWIAAYLNVLGGASIPTEVQEAWNDARDLLIKYESAIDIQDPDDRKVAIALAGMLDNYNNGLVGPGHCMDVEYVTLQQSMNTVDWMEVTGNLEDGYMVPLDPAADYHYLDVAMLEAEEPLDLGLHPFYLDTSELPDGFWAYWEGRGVLEDAEGWQGIMWKIINGQLPTFYLKVSDVSGEDPLMLVDGLQYQLGNMEYLRVDGDYLPGTYTYKGTLTAPYAVAYPMVMITFE